MSVFAVLVAREARLLFRRPAELANPLVFFAIVIAMFPLAVGPDVRRVDALLYRLFHVVRPTMPSTVSPAKRW